MSDKLADDMAESFEVEMLEHFGIDDDPLLCLEVILICYVIKDQISFGAHKTNPFVITMIEFLDDQIIEEEEYILAKDLEAMRDNDVPVRSDELETTQEMGNSCLQCDGTGQMNSHGHDFECFECEGTGNLVVAEMQS